MTVLYQQILPGGRGVRYEKVGTEDYLDCEERAAMRVGEKKDPGQVRHGRYLSRELIIACLKFVTEPLIEEQLFRGKDGIVDVAKTLEKAKWISVDQLSLQEASNPNRYEVLFKDVADFAAMSTLVKSTIESTKLPEQLTGKGLRVAV